MNPELVLKPPFIFHPLGEKIPALNKNYLKSTGFSPPFGGRCRETTEGAKKKLCYDHRLFSPFWGEMSRSDRGGVISFDKYALGGDVVKRQNGY